MKGLAALGKVVESVERHATGGQQLLSLTLDNLIEDDANVRKTYEPAALAELAESIKQFGVIEPIVVSLTDSGKYKIIAGHRRFRAAKLAGIERMPSVTRQNGDESALLQLVENLQREGLNPIDVAVSLRAALDQKLVPTQGDLARKLSKSDTWVSRHLALLAVPEDIQSLANDGVVTTYTRLLELAKLPDDLRGGVVDSLRNGDTYEQAILTTADPKDHAGAASDRAAASDPKKTPPPKEKNKTKQDPDVERLQNRLTNILGSDVKIAHKSTGRGTLTVTYASLEILEGIIERMDTER